MLTITCTQCKTTLAIDDAFAGGVCRCQHCGTIQSVPPAGGTGEPIAGPARSAARVPTAMPAAGRATPVAKPRRTPAILIGMTIVAIAIIVVAIRYFSTRV